ncbi:MAG TPA: spore coat protein U domain-containing protein, partial [Steroidobacteraceae bacterium]|nr:spore coat protein U domain-containing protein [Steroidobacteraceae bacterium]
YTVSMSAGSGTLTSRVMKSGGSQLDYNLYTNSTHTTIWGDGTSGTVKVSATSLGATYTVYGLIPALQNVPVGSYSDTVTVTVTY